MDKRDIQKEEALVLQSCFGPDIISLKTENCWKQWAPLEVRILLKPPTDQSRVFVSLQLLVQCTEDYPQSPPNIKIPEYDGLTETEVNHVIGILKNKAKTLLGEQMIFELCRTCQDYLEDLNAHPKESIHEAMIRKQELMQKEQNRIRADSELREQAEVEEENQRRRTETENRKQQEEIERQNRAKALNFGEVGEFFSVKTIFGEETKIYKRTKNTRQRRKPFHRFSTEWSGFDHSRELLVSEWSFTYTLGRKHARKTEVDLRPFLDKLESFTNTLITTLKGLGEMDQFLYPVVFVLLKKTAVELSNFNVSLLIGQAIDESDRCVEENIQTIQGNLEHLIPSMASQTVCALKWLHDRQLNHGQINANSIWLTKKSGFRISDSLIFPELMKICDLFDSMTDSTRTASPSSLNRVAGTKIIEAQRRDIFALGTLLDSITMKSTSIDDQCSEFTEVLHNFIKFCQSAKSVEQLVDHKFLSLHLLPLSQFNDSFSDSGSIFGFNQLEHSRLAKDFYAFRALGRGGFGQVLLARNKLDGNDYAVKVIPLNAENEQIIKKVTREANLLAKLKHEHVVRFYAAWIETVSSDDTKNSFRSTVNSKRKQEDSEVIFANEKSVSFQKVENSESSSDGGPGRLWQRPFMTPKSKIHTIFSASNITKSGIESEFDVIFDDEEENHQDEEEDVFYQSDITQESQKTFPKILYIQMEFCERSTLRALIDSESLLKNTQMNWRLFREILSGLQYIHGQGMIHRDIKPVNIFLDVNMSVKIGDFGLATLESFSKIDPENADTSTINNASGQTKGIGTGLYIAPEVIKNSKKTYDSRCDVYSVGIVLFEMFFRPLPLGMERLIILQNLRNYVFPEDFGKQLSKIAKNRLRELISWMMKTNPEDRPLVKDLLQHDLVPFVENEESDFQKKYKDNLRNRKSKVYQYVLQELFSLEVPLAADYLYDYAITEDPNFVEPRKQAVISVISDKLKEIFRLHGFCELNTHFFTPFQPQKGQKNTGYQMPFTVIEPNGYIVTACCDLRTNFARYCARNEIEKIKRFSISKSIFKCESPGSHPMERIECAVDIVDDESISYKMGAEILALIVEIGKLGILCNFKWTIRLGHSKLVEAICASNGCNDSTTLKQINDFLYFMGTNINKKLNIEEKAKKLGNAAEIGQNAALAILKLIEPVESMEELKLKLQKILKHKSLEVSNLAKIALEDISKTLSYLNLFYSEKLSIIFDPGLAYRPNIFNDGLMYLLQVEIPFKMTIKKKIVLAGGRYDNYFTSQRHLKSEPPRQLAAFGLNILLEGFLEIERIMEIRSYFVCKALVYPLSNEVEKEAIEILKELRMKNVKSSMYLGEGTTDVLLDYCKLNLIPFLVTISDEGKVVLYEDIELTKTSKRATYGANYVHSKILKDEVTKLIVDENQTYQGQIQTDIISNVNENSKISISASFANISINFAMIDKPPHNSRKKIENQVRSILQDMIQKFNSKITIEVFITDLIPELLLQIIGIVNRQFTKDELIRSFHQLTAGKQKKELKFLLDCLIPHFSDSFGSTLNPIILWTKQNEGSYKVII